MTASQERALSLSPASPVVPRQAIRSSQYAESDTEEEEEDIVAIPAKSSGHRRQMSDAPLLPVRDSTKTTELSPRPDFLARAKAFRDRNLGLLLIASAQCWFAGMASAVAVMAQSPQAKVRFTSQRPGLFRLSVACHAETRAQVPTWELILTRMAIVRFAELCFLLSLMLEIRLASAVISAYGYKAIRTLSSDRQACDAC